MSTVSHRPSTGQRLLARISSLSLRSDNGSKGYKGTRKRKSGCPIFESVLEPEEYMLDLGERRDEVRAVQPTLSVDTSTGKPRISDCSTLVGVPESPRDHEDYGKTPIRYKIMNPDDPSTVLAELDATQESQEPQPCTKLWEVLGPQLSETEGTTRLRSAACGYVGVRGVVSMEGAGPSELPLSVPTVWKSVAPYSVTPPPTISAKLRSVPYPPSPPRDSHLLPPHRPSRPPPPPPSSVSTVLPRPIPSQVYSRTEASALLREDGLFQPYLLPRQEEARCNCSRPMHVNPGHRAASSMRRPPVPSKPKSFRHSVEVEGSDPTKSRRPLPTYQTEELDGHRRSRHYEDDLSRRHAVAAAAPPKASREHCRGVSHHTGVDFGRTQFDDYTRRAPPIPPKRSSTIVDARRRARLGEAGRTCWQTPTTEHHTTHAPKAAPVEPCLEPLVPQVSADIDANAYETLIRGLAGKEVPGAPGNADVRRKSRHHRGDSHPSKGQISRSGDYLSPNAHASTNTNSRSDVSLGKLEEEIRTSCRVPSPKSSEAVQDVLEKAGIPAFVRAVAATYPNLVFALVNAKDTAAEQNKDVLFSSTVAVVAGPSSKRRDSGLATPTVDDHATPEASDTSTARVDNDPPHGAFYTNTASVDRGNAAPAEVLPTTFSPSPSHSIEQSNGKGKEREPAILAMPGSWSFEETKSPLDFPEVARTTLRQSSNSRSTTRSTTRSSTKKTCEACAEDLFLAEFSSHTLTSACGHENSACRACVQQWIETQLDDKMWNQVTCMQCSEVLTYNDFKRHATTESLARYDNLATRALLSEDGNFKWCLGPGCESGQIHEGGNAAPLFVCDACGYRFCVLHEGPHEGESCGQYDARLNGEPFEPEEPDMTSEMQDVLEARTVQEAHDLAEAQALHTRYERKEAIRQNELREARKRERCVRELAQAEQIAADEEAARLLQSELEGGPSSKKRTSAWIMGQREDRAQQTARDEAVARELERKDEKQRSREREEISARQKLQDRMAQKAERAAKKAAEEKARRAAARAKELAQKEAAAKKKAADDIAAKRKRREEEAAGAATVRQVSKQCPQCKWSIQKSEGCNHMRCWKCKHEFCYECLADHKEILRNDNSRHKKTCGYYA